MGHPEYYGVDLEVDTTRPFTVVTRKQPPISFLLECSQENISFKVTFGSGALLPRAFFLLFLFFHCHFSPFRLKPQSGLLVSMSKSSRFSVALMADSKMLQSSPLIRAVSSPLSDVSIYRMGKQSKCLSRRWREFPHRTFWTTSIAMQQAQRSIWIWGQPRQWARL